jgi:hypothetical protein
MRGDIVVGVVIGTILAGIAGYFTIYQDFVEVKAKVESTSLAEELKVHSGIIVPFYGSEADAELLAKDGWVICDGRTIVDEKASPTYKGKPTPNLIDRFLLGARTTGKFGGSNASDTSENGSHTHGRRQVRGSGFGDDNNDNQFLTSESGVHRHSVATVPRYMSPNCGRRFVRGRSLARAAADVMQTI